jgi:prepilin-type N-terminal cleavage/methylation domain-containing protein
MISHKLRSINRNQVGFTLIELVVAIAISGVITGAITTTIFQVIESSARTNNHMTVVRQVQDAGYWVSHDAQMAQNVELADESVDDPDGTRFPLTVTWTDWDSSEVHQVVYTLENMPSGGLKNLQRSHSSNGAPIETGIIAQFIDPDSEKTKCEFTDGKLTLVVTATVGAGLQEQSETRVYEVQSRPNPW